MQRRIRGHYIGLCEGSNRRDLLRDCLIELNLAFDFFFYFLLILLLFVCLLIFNQICTFSQNESFEFVRLEELISPKVIRGMEGQEGLDW